MAVNNSVNETEQSSQQWPRQQNEVPGSVGIMEVLLKYEGEYIIW